MTGALASFFDTSDFPARWHCGNWSAALGWTHIAADLAIFGAYAAIPLSIAHFLRRRKDVRFTPLYWLFAAFILSCGLGHFIDAANNQYSGVNLTSFRRRRKCAMESGIAA